MTLILDQGIKSYAVMCVYSEDIKQEEIPVRGL